MNRVEVAGENKTSDPSDQEYDIFMVIIVIFTLIEAIIINNADNNVPIKPSVNLNRPHLSMLCSL